MDDDYTGLLPGFPEDAGDQKRYLAFLEIGLDLLLSHRVRTAPQKRRTERLPSRDAVITEASARRQTSLTQWRFETFWPEQSHYCGALAIFAHSRDWQSRLLYRSMRRLTEKAERLAREQLSLSSLIHCGAVANIRTRIRLICPVRRIRGIPVGPEYHLPTLMAERMRHERNIVIWSGGYRRIARVLNFNEFEEVIPRFTHLAAGLADRAATRAYLEQETDPSAASPVESYGKALAQDLECYLSGALPSIDFQRPWHRTAHSGGQVVRS